jgi:anti-sigma regulatory factor (Ser/Thr protein kinase)
LHIDQLSLNTPFANYYVGKKRKPNESNYKPMKELSLHILDVAQNSVTAKAVNIRIEIQEDTQKNTFLILIEDDGKGMSEEVLKKVTDPYFTSRTTRHVGMGVPLLKQNAEMAGGSFQITSEPGKGTLVKALFQHKHYDRPPLGDMPGVISMMVSSNPDLEWVYKHSKNGQTFVFDTREVKEALEGIPLSEPSVNGYLKEMIEENLKEMEVDLF